MREEGKSLTDRLGISLVDVSLSNRSFLVTQLASLLQVEGGMGRFYSRSVRKNSGLRGRS